MSPRILTDVGLAEREAELISIARELIEAEGIPSLTIDKLAAAAPYSKGTIYNHFSGKEDLLTAICTVCIGELVNVFQRALSYPGRSRERALVLMLSYLIWARTHPQQLFTVLNAHSPSVVECSSESRLDQQENLENCLMSIVGGLVVQAIEDGDLQLVNGMTVEQVTFAMWSAAFGTLALVTTKGECAGRKFMELEREYFTNTQLVLDGLNWQPKMHEWDYRSLLKKAARKLFAEELKDLMAAGRKLNLTW